MRTTSVWGRGRVILITKNRWVVLERDMSVCHLLRINGIQQLRRFFPTALRPGAPLGRWQKALCRLVCPASWRKPLPRNHWRGNRNRKHPEVGPEPARIWHHGPERSPRASTRLKRPRLDQAPSALPKTSRRERVTRREGHAQTTGSDWRGSRECWRIRWISIHQCDWISPTGLLDWEGPVLTSKAKSSSFPDCFSRCCRCCSCCCCCCSCGCLALALAVDVAAAVLSLLLLQLLLRSLLLLLFCSGFYSFCCCHSLHSCCYW